MALPFVLWALGLLSIIGLSLSFSATLSYRLAHNAVEMAQVEAVLDAAINRAVLGLLDPRPQKRWRVDGVAQTFDFAGMSASIAIQDEFGRIDLNHADASLLSRVLLATGVDASTASKLVDKILDWKDTTPVRRLKGANAPDYRSAGLEYRPRNGPFQSLDELQLVMGMTPELFAGLRTALTVYSGTQNVDPQFAPRRVLMAVAQDVAVSASLAARSERGAGIMPSFLPLRGRAFTISAEIKTSVGTATRQTVVRLTEDVLEPYLVLDIR